MMPLVALVPLSAVLSNHSSRKSAALMVIRRASRWKSSGRSWLSTPPTLAMVARSPGVSEVGSGGIMPSSGRSASARRRMVRAYSS